jgi:hypothetical protein
MVKARPHRHPQNDFTFFLKPVAPDRHDRTVCCECMFGWYWLADACQADRVAQTTLSPTVTAHSVLTER